MKTFKLTVTQEELERIIKHHADKIQLGYHDIETSERIHSLTKRLTKDIPEIESDPRPNEPAQVTAAKDEQQTSW
jgi:hypothetical protein